MCIVKNISKSMVVKAGNRGGKEGMFCLMTETEAPTFAVTEHSKVIKVS